MYRSTKGASKARRDQINAEIRNLRDLLPISEADKSRLSYLHIMSLACIYTRKSVFLSPDVSGEDCPSLLSADELSDFVRSLPGFLLALSSDGKLIYVSENVSDHLGHSLVDLVSQGDSIYDITDSLDHLVLSSQLMPDSPDHTERLFRCRFNTSRSVRRQSAGNKMVLVRGRYHVAPAGKPVFLAFCCPLDARPPILQEHLFLAVFQSRHSRDMVFMELSASVSFYLGYQSGELVGKSWYSLVHPEDLSHASAHHYRLVSGRSETRVEMVVRLQNRDGLWTWVYLMAQTDGPDTPLVCLNYIISEGEALCVRQQLMDEEEMEGEGLPFGPMLARPDSPLHLSSPDTSVFTPLSGTPTSGGGGGGGGGGEGVSGQSFDFSGLCELGFSETRPPPDELEGDGGGRESNPPPQGDVEPGRGGGSSAAAEVDATSHLPELTYTDCVFSSPDSPTPPCTPLLPPPAPFALVGRDPYGPNANTDGFFRPDSAYERLPPSPDSPGASGGPCQMLVYPRIRGPLYIHVPTAAPDGLLTPEASPIKMPVGGCFGYMEGKAWGNVSDLGTLGIGEPPVRSPPLSSPSFSLPTTSPFLDFQTLKAWRSVDFSMVCCQQQEAAESLEMAEDFLEDGPEVSSNRHDPSGGGGRPSAQLAEDPSRQSPNAGSLGTQEAQSPRSHPTTDLSPEEQSFLEVLASYETVFETYVSTSPCDSYTDELYQLQSHGQQYFQQDGSGGHPSF